MLPLPNKLKEESKNEVYLLTDKHHRKLPQNTDGYQDNSVDALRHAYVS